MVAPTKKTTLPLLLLAASLLFTLSGFSADAHERAIPYVIRKKTSDTAQLASGENNLLMQFSSNHNFVLLASVAFTIFCSALVYFLIRTKHKRERFMEGYISETRIAKKIHDEIANEIYGTINYLTDQNDISPEIKENLLNRLDDIYFMTKNISREANSIDTGFDYPEHLTMMLASYSNPTTNVIVKGLADIDWNNVDAIKKIATYRSLQELMVNMKKHSQASLVMIDFYRGPKKIEITYADNGLGATKEQLTLKNGLTNVESRMASIDGESNFDISSGNGFHVLLTYPAHTPYVQKNFNYRRY